jgi:hypothetical protein
MGTRAIVTSQPDVACYVCGRRLLRGEHPELFLVDGEPQTVCELCAPRAAHQGWPRGDHASELTQPAVPTRRGGTLWGRLRGAARPPARRPPAAAPPHGGAPRADRGEGLLEPPSVANAVGETVPEGDLLVPAGPEPSPLESALQDFNSSEYPRRIASLSRSLGKPEVSVALDEDLGFVTVVVAWELCWYRYRVDPGEPEPEVRMVAEGRMLDELARAERLANAHADQLGELSLLAAAV